MLFHSFLGMKKSPRNLLGLLILRLLTFFFISKKVAKKVAIELISNDL